MIKNAWPCKWQPVYQRLDYQHRVRAYCSYTRRFNLFCDAPRKDCMTCYFRQADARTSDVVHVCDRCGYETSGADDKLTYITVQNRAGGVIVTAELCEACATQLGEWLHNEDFFHNFYDECPG